jgi:hypothetical protein
MNQNRYTEELVEHTELFIYEVSTQDRHTFEDVLVTYQMCLYVTLFVQHSVCNFLVHLSWGYHSYYCFGCLL